jgi:hypothetical protein
MTTENRPWWLRFPWPRRDTVTPNTHPFGTSQYVALEAARRQASSEWPEFGGVSSPPSLPLSAAGTADDRHHPTRVRPRSA